MLITLRAYRIYSFYLTRAMIILDRKSLKTFADICVAKMCFHPRFMAWKMGAASSQSSKVLKTMP